MVRVTNLCVLNGDVMSLYQRYMICYDIVDNKARTKFMNFLKDIGLFSLQKSVFVGEVNQAELRSIIRYARKNLDANEDKVFWLPTRLDEQRLRKGVGYKHFCFVPANGHATI